MFPDIPGAGGAQGDFAAGGLVDVAAEEPGRLGLVDEIANRLTAEVAARGGFVQVRSQGWTVANQDLGVWVS